MPRLKPRSAIRITTTQVKRNVSANIKSFVLKKFRQIDKAKWPRQLKAEVKRLVYLAASSHETATALGKPKHNIPHGLLVELYANTLFKEFNRFLASRNVQEFIAKRELALPRKGLQWYGTKKDMAKKISQILDSTPGIPVDKKKDVRGFLRKNREKLSSVQVHRVLHYATGLAIMAKIGKD